MRRSFAALTAPLLAAPVLALGAAVPLLATAGGASPLAGGKPAVTTSSGHLSGGSQAYVKPDCGRRWN